MDFKPKNREWVKNAAIIFLAVLLVLTFFSNTIMNRSLPEVATQNVENGNIVAKVRGTGSVAANGLHQVKASETRTIRAVMVKAGRTVEAGDVLFVLGEGDSTELEQAKEQLRQLELSYQRAALNVPSYNYSADERKIENAYQALLDAGQVRDALAESSGRKLPTEELKQTKKQLEEATLVRDAYKAAYDKLVEESQAQLSEKEELRLAARRSLTELMDSMGLEWTEAELEQPQKKLEELEAAPETDEQLLQAWRDYAEAYEQSALAREALEAISSQQLDEAQAEVDELTARVEALQDTINEIMNSSLDSEAYRNAEAAYESALELYYSLVDALEEKKLADQKSMALSALELQDLSVQIEQQKKKLEELSGGGENQILAAVSGTVSSIDCSAGDTKLKGDLLCTIEVPDMGYTLSFSVTNEQAARLRPGDSASVSNYYWGSDITATLTTIRVDPKSPQTNKLLTFEVHGNVSAGTELTLSVGQKSANYDHIVPNSAIRSDSNGSFVLKVEARNSPLGNRYYARRVPVEILASDDNSSAVVGDFDWGDFVITTSNAPVKSGEMVRLADS